jgi:SAM-dependent methyltransferase
VSELHRATRGFADGAAVYERGRPSYPQAAIDRIVSALDLRPGRTVLDLAAGTGKLTRLLVPSGANVIAVEPVREMRQELERRVRGVAALAGTAERLPLVDRSVDAVTVGQAFHWFDAGRAVAELGRVLRPGGRLGLIWNARDESRPWVAEIGAILDRHAGDAPRHRDGRWRAAFDAADRSTPLRHQTFHHLHHLDRAAVLDRFASISFIAALPDTARARVLDEIGRVLDAEPSLAGRDRIGLPYRTDLYWCERRGG